MYIGKLGSKKSYQDLFQSLGPLQFLMLKCMLLGSRGTRSSEGGAGEYSLSYSLPIPIKGSKPDNNGYAA